MEIDAPSEADDASSRDLEALLQELSDDEDTESDTAGTPDSRFDWVSNRLDDDDGDPLDQAYDANHVLVLAPLRSPTVDEICIDLATPGAPSSTNALFISLMRSTADLVDHWQRHERTLPAQFATCCAGDDAQSTHSTSITAGTSTATEITTRSLNDPSDLTRLGVAITNILAGWEDNDYETTVCVHSITALLQYVDAQRLFRFFHLLQARIDRLDGTAHYHMDPTAHGPETLSIFKTLFQTVVEVTQDGEIRVTSD